MVPFLMNDPSKAKQTEDIHPYGAALLNGDASFWRVFLDTPFTFSMVDSALTGMTLVSFPSLTVGLTTGLFASSAGVIGLF